MRSIGNHAFFEKVTAFRADPAPVYGESGRERFLKQDEKNVIMFSVG
jgi:hypothetical protein